MSALSKLAAAMRQKINIETASIEGYLDVANDPVTSRLLFEVSRANAILDKRKDKIFMDHLTITNRTSAEKAALGYDVAYFLSLPLSLESVAELVQSMKEACISYKCTPPRSWDDIINGVHSTENTKEYDDSPEEPRFKPEM